MSKGMKVEAGCLRGNHSHKVLLEPKMGGSDLEKDKAGKVGSGQITGALLPLATEGVDYTQVMTESRKMTRLEMHFRQSALAPMLELI